MFTKDHPIFNFIKTHSQNLLGVTYETYDDYAVLWFRDMESALNLRKLANEYMSYDVCSKPQRSSAMDDINPFTIDVVGITLVPKDIANRNKEYDGDALIGALMECVKAGAEIHL